MMSFSLLFSILLSFFTSSATQVPSDRWLVELKSSDDSCLIAWMTSERFADAFGSKKKLPVGNWWVVEVPGQHSPSLAELPCVLRLYKDQQISWRDKVPNDPSYASQGDMNLIGMPKAWDISTGGVTFNGDTIVVAVIDDGFDVGHQDLIKNIWINRLEVPNDGIDNDLNGYTDDSKGYNVSTEDDTHPFRTHGTSVSGIIGAAGNNGIGVSGVNWNVKLMLISGANFESDVIEAYQYVLDMRELYRQSGGAKGAFVVVTNLSGGINNAMAADHPLWCDMYNKLGEKGILSVTAAPNQSISVDVDGDMPTTCTSTYMITVTNVDGADEIVGNAGYGAISIDIGAQGEGTFTTASNNQYKAFPGTSAAAPHVAGAVALLYSTPCEEFLSDLASNPAMTATRVRDVIFENAKFNNSLDEITVTGRRIQVDAAMQATTTTDCTVPSDPGIQITSMQPNPVSLGYTQVYFTLPEGTTAAFLELYTSAGVKVWQLDIESSDVDQGFIRFDTSPLAAGVYMVTLRDGSDKVTRKLMVY